MSAWGRVVVSGVTGFVGSAVARRLSAVGAEVIGLVRPGRANSPRLADLRGRWVELNDPSLAGLIGLLRDAEPDVVIHTAAAGVEPGNTDPDELLAVNVLFTANLIRAAAVTGVGRFVHTGSCFEYGDAPAGVPISEATVLAPASVYGATKVAAGHLARTLAAQLALPLVTLRLFGVYGPGEAGYRLVPSLIDHLTTGRPLDLTPGEQVRDLLHVADVADAFALAAESDRLCTDGTPYNVSSGVPVTVRQVGTTLAGLLGGRPGLLRWGARPYRSDEAMWIVGDSTRFRAATGWRPRFDLQAGLVATVGRGAAMAA
jgi:nucleoside-diphosphate-sugar epimerase